MTTPTSALLQLLAARDALPQDPMHRYQAAARLRMEAAIINALWEESEEKLVQAVQTMRTDLAQVMVSTRMPVAAREAFSRVWTAMRTVELAGQDTPETAEELVR